MSHPLPPAAQQGRDALDRTLQGFGAYRKRWDCLHAGARWVLIGPGLLLLWFALDAIVKLPAWPLILSFAAIVGVACWALFAWVARPVLRPIDVENEAVIIEKLHGKLDNQLIGSLQLGREMAAAGGDVRLGHSPHFVAALLQNTAEFLQSFEAWKLLDLKRARQSLVLALVVLALFAGSFVFAANAVNERALRLRDAYALILETLFPVQIHVQPGDVSVLRGRDVVLQVHVEGARRREAHIRWTDSASGEVKSEMLTLEEGRAEWRIQNAQASFDYSFEYGSRQSAIHKVQVGDLPEIKTINYELAFPAYTGQPTRTLTGRVPKLRALVGTQVLVSFAATTELHPDYSFVEWQDGSRQAIQFSGRFGHFAFTVSKPERATLLLTSALAKPPHEKEWLMAQPVRFEVDIQKDEVPSVQIQLKQKKMTMFADQAAVFAFDYLAEDDFGVAEISVDYRIDAIDELLGRKPRQDSQTRQIEPPRERAKGRFADLFKTLNPPLEPGDRITVTVTAKDNNSETGPGLSRSQPIEIVIVRPDLGAFVEQKFGFGAVSPMGEMVKIKRSTDLLVDPDKTVRTEKEQKIEKKDVKTLSKQEAWPSGAEDATGDYFRLLSGEK